MAAVEFEIRVTGPVSDAMLDELDDLHLVTESVETVLRGPVSDQAALIGLINRLQALGLELRGVQQLGAG